jgi:hypothetical protein
VPVVLEHTHRCIACTRSDSTYSSVLCTRSDATYRSIVCTRSNGTYSGVLRAYGFRTHLSVCCNNLSFWNTPIGVL